MKSERIGGNQVPILHSTGNLRGQHQNARSNEDAQRGGEKPDDPDKWTKPMRENKNCEKGTKEEVYTKCCGVIVLGVRLAIHGRGTTGEGFRTVQGVDKRGGPEEKTERITGH